MRANYGWNTWDVEHTNAMVHLEGGLRVRFLLVDPKCNEVKEQFDWQHNLDRLGPHAGIAPGYARIDLKWGELTLDLQYAVEGDRLACRAEVTGGEARGLIVVVDGIWGARVHALPGPFGLRVFAGGGEKWSVAVVSANEYENQGDDRLVFRGHGDQSLSVLLDICKEGAPVSGKAEEILTEQWLNYEQVRLRTDGWLGSCADGLTRSIHWNTIWEPIKGRVCTPVSREWCNNSMWGGYVLFDWDTFFCGLMAGLETPDLMRANFQAILQEVTADGFVPNFGAATGASNDRSQPPVGAYSILKAWRGRRLALTSEQIGLLEKHFDALFAWHEWWMAHRDGNHDGLLEWGSSPIEDSHAWENNTLRAAMYESGLDNSPMYDEARFNKNTHTMELSDVGLNALYALDAWALSEIAAEIGRNETARSLHEEYVELARRINQELWNEDAGIYQNRDWNGKFSARISPTNFYPLIAGIAPPERALRMVKEHLLNPEEFWGQFVLPSIARNDPGYRKGEVIRDGVIEGMSDYWRGRIWGPMNFLVSEGLRRYAFDEVGHEMAKKSVGLFLQEWDNENHVHENYNDLSGEGDDVPSANALYHWGALLGYIGIQELADCEAWNGWRFGNLDAQVASVHGIQLVEGRLDVESSAAGLVVNLDERILLRSSAPVIVRGYRIEPGCLQFSLSGKVDSVNMTIGLLDDAENDFAKVRVGQIFELGEVKTLPIQPDHTVSGTFPVPCEIEVKW